MLWRLAEFVFVSNQLHRSTWLRVLVLRWFGATIGSECLIMSLRVRHPHNLRIGDRSLIGERVCIDNPAQLTIGSDSCVSQECFLITGSHDLATMRETFSPITIGNGVWLTTRTIVVSDAYGLTIADDVVVTPGSVVARSLGGPTTGVQIVYGGNPVRKIREYSTQPEDNHATV